MSDLQIKEKRITAWSLIRPFWFSEQKWQARGLLLLVVAMNLALVYINVRINSWNARFYDSIQTRNRPAFTSALIEFSILAFAFIVIAVYRIYFRQMLEFRWRQWLTHRYVRDWLGERAFYRIERDRLADNPDQRIADDLQSLATTTLALSLGLLSTLVTLGSFVFILWRLSGALTFVAFGTHVSIPGYMVWAAALYALAGSLIMQRFGHPLVSVNYQQQRVEADFRFMLIRLRENSEQIALYDGVATEAGEVRGAFARIRSNWWLVMKYTKRLTLVNALYGQIASIFPILAAAPRYFAGAFTIGVLFQIGNAFGQVSDAMSWFINSYGELASWRATVNRLREFRRVIDDQHFAEALSPATDRGGINLRMVDTPALRTIDLALALPDGTPLTDVGSQSFEPGSRWLIQGASGTGKSTLLRALAGLWPFGQGSIEVPLNAGVMFVPQQSYVPIGTFRNALCYPSAPGTFSDEACREVLAALSLSSYADRLDESTHWARRLSPGEQQRLAIARVLLQKPDFVFLDEATSALDPAGESLAYGLLLDRLPGAAIVSVAHRQTLESLHERVLRLEPAVRSDLAMAGR